MNSSQNKVREFHKAFDIHCEDKPTRPTDEIIHRRSRLILEEFDELIVAMTRGDLIGIADGIADLLYVVLGTAVECGIDIEPIFNEVHRSNMSKVGGYKNEFGKWIKPSSYSPADLKPILLKQLTGE
jgi:predicted HAD superfamily Cof-like phosphohydrolase